MKLSYHSDRVRITIEIDLETDYINRSSREIELLKQQLQPIFDGLAGMLDASFDAAPIQPIILDQILKSLREAITKIEKYALMWESKNVSFYEVFKQYVEDAGIIDDPEVQITLQKIRSLLH